MVAGAVLSDIFNTDDYSGSHDGASAQRSKAESWKQGGPGSACLHH